MWHKYFSAFFLKQATLSSERDLQRYSQPSFKPFTTTISMLLQEVEQERIPERSILYELEKRINSFLPIVNRTLRTALSERNNEQLLSLYSSLMDSITQFRQRIIQSVSGSQIDNKIANIVDIQKFQRVKNELVSLLSAAAEIDATIRDLSIQIRNLPQTEHKGLIIPDASGTTEPFPSLDLEEQPYKSEKQISLDFPKEFVSFFNDIGIISSLRYSEFKDGLVTKVDPAEKIMFERNLDALRRLATQGYIMINVELKKGKETKIFSERYSDLSKTLNKYTDIINGRRFEDMIVEHPEILKDIISRQIMAEKHGKTPEGTKKTPIMYTSELAGKDQEKSHPEAGGVFNQFEVPMELKLLMDKFGIKDEFSVIQTGEEVNDNFFKKEIIPDLLQNPEKYMGPEDLKSKGVGIEVLSPEERIAYTTNRAAFNYSMYQFHAMHAVIAAILKRLIPYIRAFKSKGVNPNEMPFVQEQMDNLLRVLRIVFPSELISAARNSVMADDKKLMTKDLIMKKDPNYNWKLFDNVIDSGEGWYETVMNTMMEQFFKKSLKDAPETEMGNIKKTKQKQVEDVLSAPSKKDIKKQKLYFIFSAIDRAGPVTTMLAYAYGGLYWIRIKDITKPSEYLGYEDVLAINPSYFSKRIIFKSILDYNQETFTTNAPAKVSEMAAHVQEIIENKPVDEKTAFYLAYGRASLDNTIDTKIGWTQDLMSVLNEWVVNFNPKNKSKQVFKSELPQGPPPTLAHSYNYKYPLNYLFK